MMIIRKIAPISFILGVLSVSALGQQIEVGLFFAGDMEGETIRIVNEDINMNIGGSDAFLKFGVGFPDEILRRLRNTSFYLRKRNSRRFKKLNLEIPDNPKKYLVFQRTRIPRNVDFVLEWRDNSPRRQFDSHIKDFAIDTSNLVFKTPDLVLRCGGKPFDVKDILNNPPFPNQLLLFDFYMKELQDSSGRKLIPIMDGIEVIFADDRNNMVRRTVFLGSYFVIQVFWPGDMELTPGSALIFNIVYTYKENGEPREKGLISKRFTF